MPVLGIWCAETWPTHNATSRKSVIVQAGVNRWTDNIWCAESYVKKKFGVVGKDFWNNLEGVTDDIDNV